MVDARTLMSVGTYVHSLQQKVFFLSARRQQARGSRFEEDRRHAVGIGSAEMNGGAYCVSLLAFLGPSARLEGPAQI